MVLTIRMTFVITRIPLRQHLVNPIFKLRYKTAHNIEDLLQQRLARLQLIEDPTCSHAVVLQFVLASTPRIQWQLTHTCTQQLLAMQIVTRARTYGILINP